MSGGKAKILVVGPPALSRIIQCLFEAQPEFEVVRSIGGLKHLGSRLRRLDATVIVMNVKPVGTNIPHVVRAIKRSSPLSKLIVICPLTDLAGTARACGADACLEPGQLVRRLVPATAKLSPRGRRSISRNTLG